MLIMRWFGENDFTPEHCGRRCDVCKANAAAGTLRPEGQRAAALWMGWSRTSAPIRAAEATVLGGGGRRLILPFDTTTHLTTTQAHNYHVGPGVGLPTTGGALALAVLPLSFWIAVPHALYHFVLTHPSSPSLLSAPPLPLPEQDVTAAARELVELVRHLCHVARDPRSAVFVMELFRGSPTARNKAAVSQQL